MIKKRMQDVASIKNDYLTVILDDGDDVISSIEQAFKQQNIKRAVLISAEGSLNSIRIAISRAGTIRQRMYSETLKIKQVYGEFNKVKDDYFGDINISFENLFSNPNDEIQKIMDFHIGEIDLTESIKIINPDLYRERIS